MIIKRPVLTDFVTPFQDGTKLNYLDEAKEMVAESVKIYNEYRPHTALKHKTPDEVHRAF